MTPEGKKTFTVKYRYGLTQKRMSIGVYPRVSLAAARQRAMDAMRKVDDGTDPSKLRRQADLRVDAIVSEFITRYAKPRNRKWMESERILLREFVAVFGQKDIREVTRADVIEIMDGAIERGAHYSANRILSNVRKLYNWCIERGIVEKSPIVGLKAPTKEVARDRVLSDDEIKAVLRACRNDTYPFRQFAPMLLATYAYNGTGKTRLSMAFKDIGKAGDTRDTLYFNAFTEDLFSWDNDLEGDSDRKLKLNRSSRFFRGLESLELDNRIRPLLQRYANFDFVIDARAESDDWNVRFFRTVTVTAEDGTTTTETPDNIKVSRGEENIFIWCFFLAIVELAIDGDETYEWVRFIYIDDPISSLDEHNAISVACQIAAVIKGQNRVKAVVSTHHTLFFNALYNELGKNPVKLFLGKAADAQQQRRWCPRGREREFRRLFRGYLHGLDVGIGCVRQFLKGHCPIRRAACREARRYQDLRLTLDHGRRHQVRLHQSECRCRASNSSEWRPDWFR